MSEQKCPRRNDWSKMSKEKISESEFKNELLKLYNIYGRITKSTFKKYSIYKDLNFEWYCKKFGGIKNILEEFGVERVNYNTISKDEIIFKAINLYHKNGRIDKNLCTENGISSCVIRRLFGGFNNLFKEIDAPINMNKKVTEKMVIEDFLKFYEKYQSSSSTLYRKYGSYNQTIIDSNFGSWELFMGKLNIPFLGNSSPELFIKSELEKSKIVFETHKNWNWLITPKKTKMFVDFYLNDYNIVIEYDGQQHYQFVKFFHKTEKKFLECVERDKIKEKLLLEHNICVLRIRFDEDILSRINEIIQSL